MSNGRKLKRAPKHECSEEGRVWHGECAECGHADDVYVCATGANDFLAEMKAEQIFDCPACNGEGVFSMRIGRAWLGEPRFIWRCANGCTPAVLREALIARGIDLGCLGTYGDSGERTALYRMFGPHDELLYIGISKNFGVRWSQHAESKPWYPEVQRQTVDWFGSRAEALEAEEVAIKAEKPRYNIVHATSLPAAFRHEVG